MSETFIKLPSKAGEPAWEAAYLLPTQGHWSEEDFLQLQTNRLAELVNGSLEVLPTPSWLHQLILEFLFDEMRAYVRSQNLGGKVLVAPLPVRLFPGTIREPDLLYVTPANFPQDVRGYPTKIDLAVEIVSSGVEAHQRDYIDKRVDYAKAAISEYWIVDPEQQLITVLGLCETAYETLGEYRAGQSATSRYWPGFAIAVDRILSIGKN